jgi:hypothetical protein
VNFLNFCIVGEESEKLASGQWQERREIHEGSKRNPRHGRIGGLPSGAQEVRQLPTQTVTLSGAVATIDHDKRIVNIKKADGSFETVDVPASAQRFDEL